MPAGFASIKSIAFSFSTSKIIMASLNKINPNKGFTYLKKSFKAY